MTNTQELQAEYCGTPHVAQHAHANTNCNHLVGRESLISRMKILTNLQSI